MPVKKPHDTQHLTPREPVRMRSSTQRLQPSVRTQTTVQPPATRTQLTGRSGFSVQEIKHPAARAHAIRRQRRQTAVQQAATQTGTEQPQQVGMQIEYTQQLGSQPQQHGANVPQLVKLTPGTTLQFDFDTGRITVT